MHLKTQRAEYTAVGVGELPDLIFTQWSLRWLASDLGILVSDLQKPLLNGRSSLKPCSLASITGAGHETANEW